MPFLYLQHQSTEAELVLVRTKPWLSTVKSITAVTEPWQPLGNILLCADRLFHQTLNSLLINIETCWMLIADMFICKLVSAAIGSWSGTVFAWPVMLIMYMCSAAVSRGWGIVTTWSQHDSVSCYRALKAELVLVGIKPWLSTMKSITSATEPLQPPGNLLLCADRLFHQTLNLLLVDTETCRLLNADMFICKASIRS